MNLGTLRNIRRLIVVVMLVGLLGVWPAAPAYAQTFTDCGSDQVDDIVDDLEDGGIFIFSGDCTSATITVTEPIEIDNDAFGGITTEVQGNGVTFRNPAGRVFFVLDDSTLILDQVTVTGVNDSGFTTGGGVYNEGIVIVRDSTFEDNTVSNFGGAIFNHGNMDGSATVTVERSTFLDNDATLKGGAIFNLGSLQGNGVVNITNSTFAGNEAPDGGAIANDGFEGTATVSIANSTFFANQSTVSGASDIVHSNGEGGTATVTFISTILVAANNTTHNCSNVLGVITSLGHNLAGYDDASCFPANPTTGDQLVEDVGILSLENRGGPTHTYGLLSSSPAIDNGDCSTADGTDQRGVTRPQGDGCDVGAYELADPVFTITGATDGNAVVVAPDGATTSGDITFGFEASFPGGVTLPPGAVAYACTLNSVSTPCSSSTAHGYSGLAEGSYTFSVNVMSMGLTDPTPPTFAWTVDATDPTIQFATPADGARYDIGQTVLADYACSDTLSTIAQCTGTVSNGSPIDTSVSGDYTFTVTAIDAAGNQTIQTVNYSVGFGLEWRDTSSSRQPPYVNRAQAGDPLYVRFSLDGDQGLGILATGSPQWQWVSCASRQPTSTPFTAQTIGGLRYFAGADYYQLIVRTQASYANRCAQLLLTLTDGNTHTLLFQFTR